VGKCNKYAIYVCVMEQYTGKTVKESRKHIFKNVTLVLHTIYIYTYIYIYICHNEKYYFKQQQKKRKITLPQLIKYNKPSSSGEQKK
jgi:hypothetical protein